MQTKIIIGDTELRINNPLPTYPDHQLIVFNTIKTFIRVKLPRCTVEVHLKAM
jgi:hypothetical protein